MYQSRRPTRSKAKRCLKAQLNHSAMKPKNCTAIAASKSTRSMPPARRSRRQTCARRFKSGLLLLLDLCSRSLDYSSSTITATRSQRRQKQMSRAVMSQRSQKIKRTTSRKPIPQRKTLAAPRFRIFTPVERTKKSRAGEG